MSTDPLGSSYLVKRLSAASSSLGSTMGTADGGGVGGGVALTTRGSLTPSRAPVKKVTFMRRRGFIHPGPVHKGHFFLTLQANNSTSSGLLTSGNLMALLVLSLLFFSLCSSVYLLHRVHALQLQVQLMNSLIPRVNH